MEAQLRQLEAALTHVDHAIGRLERAAEERQWYQGPGTDVGDIASVQQKLAEANVLLLTIIPVDRFLQA